MRTSFIKDSGRKSFDIQEAAILLDEYLKGIASGRRISETARLASQRLRQLAVTKGMKIPPSFRSPVGIQGRLRSLEGVYENRETLTIPGTEVFRQIIELYDSDRDRFEELLKDALSSDQNRSGERMSDDYDAKEAVDMALKEKNMESNFFMWLSTELDPKDYTGVINSYRTVNAMLLQKKALTKPIAETQDSDAIETVQKKIKAYIGGRQLRYQAARILSLYLNYLQCETLQEKVEDQTESIESNWIELTDANYQQFERTRPIYCEVGRQTYDGQNWARVLTAIANHEIDSDNPRIQGLYVKSLLSDRKNRPFFMNERIEGLNCSQLENGYWINVNYSIPRLMQIIYSFCIFCGYEDGQIKICGIPKDKHGTIARPIKNGRKRISREGKDLLEPFYNYLVEEKNLAERTAGNYCTSIRMIELYIQEHSLDLSVIEATSNNIQNVIDTLMGRSDFIEINDKRHHQFGAAMAQYALFLRRGLDASSESVSGVETKVIHASETVDDGLDELLVQRIEKAVLEADLSGRTFDDLAEELGSSVLRVKKAVQQSNNIVDICNRLIHKEAFIDWEDNADILEGILDRLMTKNNGYVSDAQLFDYARMDMQMFINDHDMDSPRKIFDVAEHLFEKEGYHGKHYSFIGKSHISRSDEVVSSKMDIMKKFARDHGGIFSFNDLEEYLESIGVKNVNLRQQMKIYEQPVFFYIEEGTFITAESMGVNDAYIEKIRIAMKRLFSDGGDHIVLRDIQSSWFHLLPELPQGQQWTPLLLQSILRFYSKQCGAHTIYGLENQAGDTLHAMVVSNRSEIQTFSDAVIAMLLEEGVSQRKFEAEELRRMLVQRGMIAGNELIWNMPKALPNDGRYVWDADGHNVTINI